MGFLGLQNFYLLNQTIYMPLLSYIALFYILVCMVLLITWVGNSKYHSARNHTITFYKYISAKIFFLMNIVSCFMIFVLCLFREKYPKLSRGNWQNFNVALLPQKTLDISKAQAQYTHLKTHALFHILQPFEHVILEMS